MTTTIEALLLQHPTNAVHNTLSYTASDKVWARAYKVIKNTQSHTVVRDGITHANFDDAFLPPLADDALRMKQPAVPPNNRHWRLETEADCENWFNTEIVNVVLSAWHAYPPITQTSHTKPLRDVNISENIDMTFSIKVGSKRYTMAIGEIKRNLLEPVVWQNGRVATAASQAKLSQELRG